MAVAKTYKKYPIIGEPFTDNKRAYVMIKTPSGEKRVRWYTDREYARMYPEAQKPEESYNYKRALGFNYAGYITIYIGADEDNEWWFRKQSNCYLHKIWGWYTHSDKEIPDDLPEGVITKRLYWTNVCTPEGTITEASAQKGYDMTVCDGSFIGKLGERLDFVLHVDKVIPLVNQYGNAYMHIMSDEYKNQFIWTTSSRALPIDCYHIKGTIKDHRTYHGINQTILTRCSGFERTEMRYH